MGKRNILSSKIRVQSTGVYTAQNDDFTVKSQESDAVRCAGEAFPERDPQLPEK